jgi:hypothetical protein
VLDRWAEERADRRPADGTELVRVHLDLLPLKEWPL